MAERRAVPIEWTSNDRVLDEFRHLQQQLASVAGDNGALRNALWESFQDTAHREGLEGRLRDEEAPADAARAADRDLAEAQSATVSVVLYWKTEKGTVLLNGVRLGQLRKPQQFTTDLLALRDFSDRFVERDSADYDRIMAIFHEGGADNVINMIWNAHSQLFGIRLEGLTPVGRREPPVPLAARPLRGGPGACLVSHEFLGLSLLGKREGTGAPVFDRKLEGSDRGDCLVSLTVGAWAAETRGVVDPFWSDGALAVSDLKPFLQVHRVGVTAVDTRLTTVWEYLPVRRNKRTRCSHMWILVHNGHAFRLDRNLPSLVHRRRGDTAAASLDYPRISQEEVVPVADAAGLLDFMLATREVAAPKPFRVHIASGLDDLFRRSRLEWGLEPGVTIDAGTIIRLEFRLQNTYVVTDFPVHNPEEGRFPVAAEEYELFTSWTRRLMEAVLTPSLRSEYSPGLMWAQAHLTKAQLVRRFAADAPREARGIDIVRAYTHGLMSLPGLPVFCALDDWEPVPPGFRVPASEPMTLYLVRQGSGGDGVAPWMIANRPVSVVSGLVLEGARALGVTLPEPPFARLRPAHVAPNPVRGLIAELYSPAVGLPDRLKKFIVNSVIGLCNKKYSRRDAGSWTTDIHEARHLAGGGLAGVASPSPGEFVTSVKSEPVQLQSGFLPIGFMVYDVMRLQLLGLYRKLRDLGANVYGVSTDCFFVDAIPAGLPMTETKTPADFGGFHDDGVKPVPEKMWTDPAEGADDPSAAVGPPRLDWSAKVVETLVPGTVVTGKLPGSGKTHFIAGALPREGTLFLTATNEQIKMIAGFGHTAETMCHFMGFRVGHAGGLVSAPGGGAGAGAVAPPKRIVVDEVYQQSLFLLQHFVRWAEEHEGIEFYATGDMRQTHGVDAWNGVARDRARYVGFLRRVFPNELILRGSRRLTDPVQVAELERIHDDLFLRGIPPLKVAGIQRTSSLEGMERAVTLMNVTAQAVNRIMAPRPDRVVAKRHHPRLTVNGEYAVIREDGTDWVIDLNGRPARFPKSWFRSPFSFTAHSLQGGTVRERYAILDAGSPWATAEWFWVALTRTDDLNKVFVYVGPAVTRPLVLRERYPGLGLPWIRATLKEQNYCCALCHELIDLGSGGLEDWSIDRRSGLGDHIPSDVHITHLKCNLSKSGEKKPK